MFFTVVEIQKLQNGSKAAITTIYDDYNDALGKFFNVCAVAVAGDLPYHSCVVIGSNGQITDQRIFNRDN